MLDGAENQGGTAVETQVNGETNSQGGETTAPQGETHAESAPKEGTDSGAAIAADQAAPGEGGDNAGENLTTSQKVSSYAAEALKAAAAQQQQGADVDTATKAAYQRMDEILSKIPQKTLNPSTVPAGPAAPIGAAAIASGALADPNARQAVAEPSAVVTDFVLYHPLHPTKTAEGTYDTVEESAVFNNGVTHDDALAALVVRVFPATDEQPASVNLLVFSDGGGIVHKQNVVNGTGLGQWSWA